MKRSASPGLMWTTMACLVLVNVLVAQTVLSIYYPNSAARLGPAVLTGLAVVALICGVAAVQGWRAYVRRPPEQ